MQNTSNQPLAVVTGASSGIGFELAKQFAQHGFDLIIAADSEKIIEVAKELQATGVSVEPVQVDLATREGVDILYNRIQATQRFVEAVAINAGIGVGGEFASTNLDEEFKVIDLNVTSAVHLAKHMVQGMVAQGRGRILFTASVVATAPAPYQAVYSGSKAFLYSFSEALRYELKDKGITVTALLPDATETNFFHRAGMENTTVGRIKKDDPALVAKQGFDALMKGEDQVLAGSFKNRAKNMANDFLPETFKAKMLGELSKPDAIKNQSQTS
ncbi:MAG: SDR family NAD(P)-dependent oxidoreductase [Pseudomonadota bacterium]